MGCPIHRLAAKRKILDFTHKGRTAKVKALSLATNVLSKETSYIVVVDGKTVEAESLNHEVEELLSEPLQVQQRHSRSGLMSKKMKCSRSYRSNNVVQNNSIVSLTGVSLKSCKKRSSASRTLSSAPSTMKAFQMQVESFNKCKQERAITKPMVTSHRVSKESAVCEEEDRDEEKVVMLKDEHFETFKMIWTVSIKKLQRKKVMIQENSQPHTLYEEAKKAGVSQNKWQSWLRKRLTKLMLRVVFSNSEEQSLQVNMHCTYKELLITLASKLSTEAGKIVVKVDDKTLNVPDSQADVTLLTSLGLKNGSLLVVTC